MSYTYLNIYVYFFKKKDTCTLIYERGIKDKYHLFFYFNSKIKLWLCKSNIYYIESIKEVSREKSSIT